MEGYFDGDLCSYSNAIFSTGRELPFFYRLDGFLIQSHAERSCNPDVTRLPRTIDDNDQDYDALVFHATGFIRVFRVGSVDCLWRSHTFAGKKYAGAATAIGS